jgi:hypothetical protein
VDRTINYCTYNQCRYPECRARAEGAVALDPSTRLWIVADPRCQLYARALPETEEMSLDSIGFHPQATDNRSRPESINQELGACGETRMDLRSQVDSRNYCAQQGLAPPTAATPRPFGLTDVDKRADVINERLEQLNNSLGIILSRLRGPQTMNGGPIDRAAPPPPAGSIFEALRRTTDSIGQKLEGLEQQLSELANLTGG